jgi:diguanylate cyclase (GGDEF)-like protein
VLLDVITTGRPSAIVCEMPAGREGAIELLNQLTELKQDACVILIGPEMGAESVAHCLRHGAFDYLTVPVAATRLVTALQEGLVNREALLTAHNLSEKLAHSNHMLAGERNRLKQWNRNLLALNHLTQVLTGSLDRETIVQALFTGLATLVPLDIIGLRCTGPSQVRIWSRSSAFAREEMLIREQLSHRYHEDVESEADVRRSMLPTLGDNCHTITIPLVLAPKRKGLLHLERRQGTFTESEFHVLSTVGTSLTLALRNAETHRQFQELACRDGLTGLLNRRALEQVIEREFKAGTRYRSSACFLLVDLDFFKSVNDRFGHLAGDQVLTTAAALMRKTVRDIDEVGRFGGEEFGIVLPHTDLDRASVLAERLRRQIEMQVFETDQGIVKMTASIGIAHIPGMSIRSLSEWIAAADAALYDAKALGRNRVVVHVPDQTVSIEPVALAQAAS